MRAVLIISLFWTVQLFAQAPADKLADKALAAYENYNYKEAAKLYNQLDTSHIGVLRHLSISWWRSDDLGNAQRGFAKVVEMEGHTHEDIFTYVRLLREVEYYDEAEKQMEIYCEMFPKADIAIDFGKNKGKYKMLSSGDTTYQLIRMNFNSNHQEFGASYYNGGICFVSSREGTEPIRRRYNVTGLPFLDLYTANLYDTNLVAIVPFPGDINGKFHEGPAAFNASSDLMIFSKNDILPAANGHYYYHLYWSEKTGGGWSSPKRIAFDTTACSSGHPSISGDGKWLYFSSTMKGGDGGADIWKVEILGPGSFGTPVNLGAAVNTEGNETYPYIHPDNNLFFFSSDSRYGIGGMDVFVAEVKPDGSMAGSSNMGAPVNSSADDFAFILSKEKTSGFVSSNRKGTRGSDDIWFIDIRSGFQNK